MKVTQLLINLYFRERLSRYEAQLGHVAWIKKLGKKVMCSK